MKALSALLMMFIVVAAHADHDVIGTIQFSLDGDEQTWYVLESPKGLRSNALWLETGPDRSTIAVTAFESADFELVSHDATGSAVPDGSAPALLVSIGFPAGAREQAYILPIDQSTGPAGVMLLNDFSYDNETNAALSGTLGEFETLFGSAARYQEVLDGISTVDRATVNDCFARYADLELAVRAWVGPDGA